MLFLNNFQREGRKKRKGLIRFCWFLGELRAFSG